MYFCAMKKILISLLFIPIIGFTQTFVSTNIENRNIILEDFTGISCSACPGGHIVAKQILDANPNDVFIINIHTGQFATPQGPGTDFNTISGALIGNQAGISAYPAGNVNRHQFPMTQSGGTAMSRVDWDSASTIILSQVSPVNIGLQSNIDMATNTLTVDVEVYYTGLQSITSNMLNIAVVQNNIEGPQSGRIGVYNHNDMLRHMITGTWGEQITNINPNTLYTNQYSWLMPDSISDVFFDPANIYVVAFVSEGNQEILSGTGVTPDIVFEHDWDADCLSSAATNSLCGAETDLEIKFRNYGNQNLNTLDFNYSINNGSAQTFSWSGNLLPTEYETISISGVSFVPQALNTVNINTLNPNGNMDQNFINDSTSTSFLQYNADGQVLENFIGGYATINLTTDRWGFETSWEMVSDDGTIVAFVPPNTFPTLQSNDTTSIAPVSIFLNPNACYSFIIYDSGDGLCCYWGEGSYSVTDALGDTIVSGGEGMWSEEATHFKTNGNGTVINDIIKNKKLIRIIDLLGRETKGTKNTPLFYIYDDGTVEKKIILE